MNSKSKSNTHSKSTRIKRFTLAFLVVVMAGSGVAIGQGSDSSNSGRHKRNNACKNDIERFCSGATDRKDRRQCIREHKDEMTQGCQNAIESHRRHRKGRDRGDRADSSNS